MTDLEVEGPDYDRFEAAIRAAQKHQQVDTVNARAIVRFYNFQPIAYQ